MSKKDWQQLNQYREAEAAGLLAVLPCRIGDTVYWIMPAKWDENGKAHIEQFTVRELLVTADGILVGDGDCCFDALGKDCWLNYEDAKKKLEEENA